MRSAVNFRIAWLLGLLAVAVSALGRQTLPSQWAYAPITEPSAVAYSPDSTLLAIAGDGGVQVYSASTGVLSWCVATSARQTNSIAFSRDGSLLAIGGELNTYAQGGEVEIWNVSAQKLLQAFQPSATMVQSVALSPDGKSVAIGGTILGSPTLGSLEVWSVADGTHTANLKTTSANVTSVQYSPDGTVLAALGTGQIAGQIELWSTVSQSLEATLATFDTPWNALAFAPDGKSLAASGYYSVEGQDFSPRVQLWDVTSMTLSATLKPNCYTISSIAYTPDGASLALGEWQSFGYQTAIEFWSTSTYTVTAALQGRNSPEIAAMGIAPNGASVAAFATVYDYSHGGYTTEVDTWDLSTGAPSTTLYPQTFVRSTSTAFTPDGSGLVLGSTAGYGAPGWIGLFETSTGRLTKTFPTAADYNVSSVAVTHDNSILADCGDGVYGKILELWGVSSGNLIDQLPTSATGLNAVAFSPNGSLLAAAGYSSAGGLIELWDVATLTLRARLPSVAGFGVQALAFSPDGSKLISCGSGENESNDLFGALEVWDLKTGDLIGYIDTTLFSITSLAISADGTKLADGGLRYLPKVNTTECAIEVWDLSSFKFKSYLPVVADANPISSLAFSADGSMLVSGNGLGLEIYDVVNKISLVTYPLAGVSSVAASTKNDQIAYTSGSLLAVAENPFAQSAPVASLSLSPVKISAGGVATGTIRLSKAAPAGGATVTLLSSGSAVTVPNSIIVPGGATSATFTVSATGVAKSTTITLTAGIGSSAKSEKLTVVPATLSSLTMSVASIIGGNDSVGTVSLSGPAGPGGFMISLKSSSSAITTPSSVTVAAGQTSAIFIAKCSAVNEATKAVITGTLSGKSESAHITVLPPALASLSLNPITLPGGSQAVGTITLTGVAPAGGLVISIKSSSKSASVPKSIRVPAGQNAVTFTVDTTAVGSATVVTLDATSAGSSQSATLTIT